MALRLAVVVSQRPGLGPTLVSPQVMSGADIDAPAWGTSQIHRR